MRLRRSVQRALIRAATLALLAAAGCSTPAPSGSQQVKFAAGQAGGGKVTEAQLQDSLFRFSNRFWTWVTAGTQDLTASSDPKIRQQALLRQLLYDSTSLDIALGPSPQANLLDMVAFIELSRRVWSEYWIPRVFGARGDAMARGFEQASSEIWNLAAEVLDEKPRERLARAIQAWSDQHRDQLAVENFRFSQFAAEAGARARQMQEEVGGLLASVESATQVGDRALLFAERALYYAQRAPFLWRLQAQAGTREVLGEAMSTLEYAGATQAFATDMTELLGAAGRVLEVSARHPEVMRLGVAGFGAMGEMLRELNQVLSNPRTPEGAQRMGQLAQALDARINRVLWKLFGLGSALILLFALVSLGSRLIYHRVVLRTRLTRETGGPKRGGPRAA